MYKYFKIVNVYNIDIFAFNFYTLFIKYKLLYQLGIFTIDEISVGRSVIHWKLLQTFYDMCNVLSLSFKKTLYAHHFWYNKFYEVKEKEWGWLSTKMGSKNQCSIIHHIGFHLIMLNVMPQCHFVNDGCIHQWFSYAKACCFVDPWGPKLCNKRALT